MSLSVSDYTPLLREYYTDDRVRELVYKNNPLLAMMAKMEDFEGYDLPIPCIIADSQGASRTFSEAVTSKNSLSSKAFKLTTVNDYSLASIDRKTIMLSASKKGAWLPAAKTAIDSALRTSTRRLAIGMYRGASGSIGRVSTAYTSGVAVTLSDINDVTNFEVGQRLVFSSADGGGSLKNGYTTVSSLNRDTGVLTLAADISAWATSPGAASDYIFVAGDYDLAMSGLGAWLPSSAPGSTAFFSVDRSVDPVRLGGVRVTGTSMPIEEALLKACSRVVREGGNPDAIFLNPVQFHQLILSLGSKVQRTVAEVGKLGFSAVELYHDGGMAKVFGDMNCPANVAYVLQMDSWKLYSAGPACDIFDKDSDQKMLREASSDSYEVRVGGYYNLGCNAPGFNARVSLTSVTY